MGIAGESGARLEERLDKLTEKRLEEITSKALEDPKYRDKTIKYLRSVINKQRKSKIGLLAAKEIETIQITQLLELLK